MIKLERDPLKVKPEVNKMIKLLNEKQELPQQNIQRGIVKRIIFLKIFLQTKEPSHYPNALLYDSLTSLHTLATRSERYFFFNIRSLIENTLRTILNLTDFDRTGVNELFRISRDKYASNTKIIEVISLLSDKYTYSSNFVHSNISANMEINLYFKEVTNQSTSDKDLTKLLNLFLLILTKISEIIVIVFPDEVEHIFHRKKETLIYLVNQKIVQEINS
ncbi:hypothetical protein [Salimicrobium salexigens]|uniref:Uncharacterized protein n=1 Tax=Salimicrobium salexigens TaxID=908941 RepID=A0ABY1KZM2_9BACI|nr:hypothetical protein [Salimicrobium salexigens]SIS97937.1 hypothetical protein SAMN05421758_11529 [Salimicrobium salexigens]